MQRLPITIFNNLQLTTAVAGGTFNTPANEYVTISSATVNNTTASAATLDAYIVPSGGTAGVANQIISAMAIPVSGSAPTILSALLGQTIPLGGSLQLKSSAATAISPFVSGYRTTP